MSSPPKVAPYQTVRSHTNDIQDVVHLPGGRRVITCSSDGSLQLWDLESGIQIGDDWRDRVDEEAESILALSPDGNTVASGSWNGTVRLWDIKTGKIIVKWKGDTLRVLSVCWGADGQRVVSGSWDGTVKVWDVKSGETILGPIKTGHRQVIEVIFSPDSTKFATGGFDLNAVQVWDAKTGELLTTLQQQSLVSSLAWTSDGKNLISGSWVPLIRIFDTATWDQIAILKGHTGLVDAISLSQNNRLLVSVSSDQTAHLWNLDTNLQVGLPIQHEHTVQCAAVSADGKVLVRVTGGDKDVYTWDVQAILKIAGLEDLFLPIPHVAPAKSPINRSEKCYASSTYPYPSNTPTVFR